MRIVCELKSISRFDGRRTSHWGNLQDSFTPGGGESDSPMSSPSSHSCYQYPHPPHHHYNRLHSVFWDLYCAAPERRETCDHSSEAKAFHDYVRLWTMMMVMMVMVIVKGEGGK